jgi:hypothetical protein
MQLGSDVGFIALPGGTLTRVPEGEIVYREWDWLTYTGGYFYTLAQPVLRSGLNDRPATWDSAVSRWLPVAPELVAADGRTYVWTDVPRSPDGSSQVHLVDVASGRDTVVAKQGNLVAVSYQGEAVYLVKGQRGERVFHRTSGLWRLDLKTLAVRQIADESAVWGLQEYGTYIAPGAAWRTAFDRTDPAPQNQSGAAFSMNTLIRLDLETGATATWLTRHGQEVAIVGVDKAGYPLVGINYGPDRSQFDVSSRQTIELWSLKGPESGTLVYRAPSNLDVGLGPHHGYRPLGRIVDSYGLWISAVSSSDGPETLYLYASGHLEFVASLGADNQYNDWHFAGACIN